MATVSRFEDLEIWKLARILNLKIYALGQNTNLHNDYRLYGQINGSAGSIMDNIAEGFERNGNKEFIQFLSIAKASCGETRSQLYRVYDRNYIEEEAFNELRNEVELLSKKIASFMGYLVKNEYRGTKFKY